MFGLVNLARIDHRGCCWLQVVL